MGIVDKITKYLKINNIDKKIEWKNIIDENSITLIPNISVKDDEYFSVLINTLSLEIVNGNIIIPFAELYDFYYDIENNMELKNDYEYFGLPELFKGSLFIDNKGNYYQDNKVEYILELFNDNSSYELVNNKLVYSQIECKYYTLPVNIYELLVKISTYNKYNSENLSSQFSMLSKIKEFKSKNNSTVEIILSDRLKNEECPVIIDKNILIDIKDDGNIAEVFPVLCQDEELNQQLLSQIYKHDDIQDVYITNNNGVITRFSVENKEAIEKLKKFRYTSGEDRFDILSGKGEFFNNSQSDEENIDEENNMFDLSQFGPRVNSLGYFKYRPVPSAKSTTSDFKWIEEEFPSIPGSTFDGDSAKIILNPTHMKLFNEALEKTNDGERCVVELEQNGKPFNMILYRHEIENEIQKIKNSMIKIEEIKSINDLKLIAKEYELLQKDDYISYKGRYIEKVPLEKVEERILYLEDKKNKKKLNLLISDNFDDIEYEETSTSKNTTTEAIIPSSLKDHIELFDYQKECLCKLQNLYTSSKVNGFLLCDDMGLGKTLQLLSFLAWVKEFEKEKCGPTLIVAPTLLLQNWDSSDNSLEEGEIQKFFKKDTFKTIQIRGKYPYSHEELNKYDIVFTTYESLVLNEHCFGKMKWNIVVCDEAQFVKNPSARRTHVLKAQNANFKIACTATPIENCLFDLWSLVDFCKPGLLGSLSEFKSNYINRDKQQCEDKEKEKENINKELTEKLIDFYIRREKDILPRTLKPKNIKVIRTTPNNAELQILRDISNSKFSIASINKMIHSSSILELVHSNNNLTKDDLEYILNNSSKLKLLKEILEEISLNREKVLIFTNYNKTQQILLYAIKRWFNIEPILLNGKEHNYNKRYMYLNDFKSKKGFNVAVLSPLVAGFGVTITEANHVIHYDRMWNPAKEDQATDRAYRIGQDKDVTVYYPMLSLSENSIKSYNDIVEFVEENKYRDENKLLSPEEKLNIVIARKKDILLNFFLAVNETEEDAYRDFYNL